LEAQRELLTYIRSLFAIAGVFFVMFLWLEMLGSQPFVDLRLYRNLRFVVASLAAFLFDTAFRRFLEKKLLC